MNTENSTQAEQEDNNQGFGYNLAPVSVRTKFKCREVAHTEYGLRVSFEPVHSGSPENDQFFKNTPGGSIEIATITENTAINSRFRPGDEFYVDFRPAS